MQNIPTGCYKVAMYPYWNWAHDIPLFCVSIEKSITTKDIQENTLIGGGIQMRASDNTINKMLKAKK